MDKAVNTVDIINFIPKETIVRGDISAKRNIVLDGVVEGDINCENIVQIEEGACVKGNVTCQSLYSEGLIEGNVKAIKYCELHNNAVVKGMVECASLVTDFNAIIEKGLKINK